MSKDIISNISINMFTSFITAEGMIGISMILQSNLCVKLFESTAQAFVYTTKQLTSTNIFIHFDLFDPLSISIFAFLYALVFNFNRLYPIFAYFNSLFLYILVSGHTNVKLGLSDPRFTTPLMTELTIGPPSCQPG